MIPFTEFSQGDNKIHFAHANGYPSGVYQKFLSPFLDDYGVIAMDARPMWEDSKPSDLKNWKTLADDMALFFKQQDLRNVIGMGHSMGGIASLICAAQHPGMFKKLILIDPVIIDPKGLFVLKMPSFIKKRFLPMIGIAERRRNQWSTREEAVDYFKSKKIYGRFDNDAFNDFIKYGLKENESGLTLAYSREWEAKIYSSVSSAWSIIKNPPCPIIIVRAEYSDVLIPSVWSDIKKKAKNTTFINMPKVGHMMPLEKPIELANVIKEVI